MIDGLETGILSGAMLYWWDMIGTFFFCVSGVLAGMQKKFDIWGLFVIAIITGTGGGTLRSMLIGDTPPPVFADPGYIICAAVAVPCGRLFPKLWEKFSREVSVVDALGLGIFACVGAEVGQQHGLDWWACIGMGAITATFGGVIRDVVRNELPLVFRKEIYATAALIGAAAYLAFGHFGMSDQYAMTLATFIVATIRLLAIRYAVNQSAV